MKRNVCLLLLPGLFLLTGCFDASMTWKATRAKSTDSLPQVSTSPTPDPSSSPSSTPSSRISLSVDPVYPAKGRNWNDYIIRSDATHDANHQPDLACTGTEVGSTSKCIHAGDKRKVVVPTESSCSGMSIADSLGVFNWTCVVEGGKVTFYLLGFKGGKGLRDLVESTGWKQNSVQVSASGSVIGESTSGAWWSNPVIALPDNSAIGSTATSLAIPGTVYYLGSSRSSGGYFLSADRIGVVTAPGAVLSLSSGSNNCSDTGAAGATRRCLLAASSTHFHWIEAALGGPLTANYDGLYLYGTTFSQVRDTSTTGFDNGIYLAGSAYNTISGFRAANALFGGLYLDASSYNVVQHVNINNTRSHSIFLWGVNGIVQSNIFTDMTISGSGSNSGAITLSTNTNSNTFSHVTVTDSYNAFQGYSSPSPYTTFSNLLSVNTHQGIDFGYSSGFLFSDIASFGAQTYGVDLSQAAAQGVFQGDLLLGSNGTSDCHSYTGGQGLDNFCTNNSGSTATYIAYGLGQYPRFFGKAAADQTNSNGMLTGIANFASITDWIGFDNFFRSWGIDGGTFPVVAQIAPCTAGTCRIWDWRLLATDSIARGRFGSFVAGAACPSSVDGSQVISDQQTPNHTYLKNAIEVLRDPFGNDNGLCESNEACIFAPNLGSYQGEGDIFAAGTCAFHDGTVTGVKMYGFPTNGI